MTNNYPEAASEVVKEIRKLYREVSKNERFEKELENNTLRINILDVFYEFDTIFTFNGKIFILVKTLTVAFPTSLKFAKNYMYVLQNFLRDPETYMHGVLYEEAQKLFDKVNARDAYEDLCLLIEYNDEEWLVTYLDDSCITLQPGRVRYNKHKDSIFVPQEDWYKVLQTIVDTDTTKVMW